MTPAVIFSLSGLAIVTMLVAKKLGERRKKPFFILDAISKGDIYTREIYHRLVRLYSEGKDKGLFFLKRQLPMHSRNALHKSFHYLKEKRHIYARNLRDSKLLKKSDGISEFFKNISNSEKEKGEINDVFEESSQYDKKELK